jgi:hypothetical protein
VSAPRRLVGKERAGGAAAGEQDEAVAAAATASKSAGMCAAPPAAAAASSRRAASSTPCLKAVPSRVLFLCPGGTIKAPPLERVGWVGGGQRENGAGGGVGGRRPRHSQAAGGWVGGWVWEDNLTGDPFTYLNHYSRHDNSFASSSSHSSSRTFVLAVGGIAERKSQRSHNGN